MRRTHALLTLTLLVSGWSSAGATPPSPINRRVWVGPNPSDFDDRWAVSKDGRWLAFRDPESNIAIYNRRASRIRMLPVRLPDRQWRAAFAWSADNSQLAFNRLLKGHGEELVVIAIHGGYQRILASFDGPVIPIDWSADGRRIAVEIDHGISVDLVWISVATGAAERITTVANAFRNGRSFSAVLSHDSTSIAFTRITNNGSRDIFVIHADGTQESALVAHPADDYPVGYTRDGQLLFASDRSGAIDLWSIPVVPASNRARIPRQIKRNFGVARPMAVTDTGAIYYVQSQCAADILTVPLLSDGVAMPGSAKAIATRFATYNSGPDWSPSGDELVYQIGQPGSPDGIDLVFVSLRDGREVVIHPEILQFSRPRYMPDGKSVVVHGTGVDGVQGIYQIDRQSGKATLVARGAEEDLVNPVPRVNALFVESGGRSVQVFQGNGTMPVTVYASQARNANFNSAPSPDGETVAIIDGASLITVRIGESARQILSLKSTEQFHPFPGSLEWTADGRYILFTKVVGRERQVWRIPAAGGRAEAIGLSIGDQALYFLRTSHDGRSLAFVTGDCDLRPQEVWVLEHFLRSPSRSP